MSVTTWLRRGRVGTPPAAPAPPITIDLSVLRRPLRDYATEGYLEVDGWGIDNYLLRIFLALDEMQRARGVGGNLLEIGVHHGRTFILLALMAQEGERSYAIDLFEDQERNIDHSGLGDSTAFASNMRRYAPQAAYDVIAGDSLFLDFAAAGIEKVRFAHIDGAHYVDAIVNDLTKVQDQMVAGGVVVVDDFHHSLFPGVNEGCHRFLLYATPRRLIPFAVGKNKLFLTTHSHHEAYVATLKELLQPPAGMGVVLHGFPAVCVDAH
jgi:hypothetical protein